MESTSIGKVSATKNASKTDALVDGMIKYVE